MGAAQLRMPQLRMRGCGRDPGQGKRGGGSPVGAWLVSGRDVSSRLAFSQHAERRSGPGVL